MNDSIFDYGTVVDSIPVSGIGDLASAALVSVTIDSLYHTNDGDLYITLYAPNGSSIALSSYYGYGTANYIGTMFSATASTPISSAVGGPFTGSYMPDQPFSSFSGPADGQWKLNIYDNYAGNTGVLKGWSIKLSVADTVLTFAWSPSTGLSSISILNPNLTAVSSINYMITSTNSIGCSTTDTMSLNVPAVAISPSSTTACFGTSVTLNAISCGCGTNYWSPSATLSAATGNTVTATPTVNTEYYLSDTISGCYIIDSVHINANPSLFASPGPDQTICYADTAHLSGAAIGGTAPFTYVWNYSTFTYPTQNVGVVGLTTGAATLTITDAGGCTAANSLSLVVTPSTDVYGHVNYYSGSLTTGINKAVIYKYVPFLTHFDTVQVQPVNASGDYHFTSINHGDYLIKIFADTTLHADLDATYYGNKWAWDSSTVVTHNCNISDTANITMIHELGPGGGPGMLRGQITEGMGFGHAPTDPIPGVDVHLGRNPGGAAMFSTTTDNTGHYYFNNVALNTAGQYYTVYVDIPGLARDSSYSVVLSPTNNQYMYLDYYVDSTAIHIVPSAGVSNPDMATANKFNVYPNPFKENTSIEYSISADANVKLDVYNVLGIRINSIVSGKQTTGNYKYNLNNLNTGVYFITLSVDKNVSTQRVIVIE